MRRISSWKESVDGVCLLNGRRKQTENGALGMCPVLCYLSFVEHITAAGEPSPPLELEPVVVPHPGAVGTLRRAAQSLSSESASGRHTDS